MATKTSLSAYDTPGPLLGDPLPVEGEEPLTAEELAHCRIQADTNALMQLHKDESKLWREAFNNVTANLKKVLTTFEQNQATLGIRLASLEKRLAKSKRL
jgi:hypothetical protein